MNQEQATSLLQSGKNVFLTGSAGTGKTYLLNHYIQYLKARKIKVAVTASTGIAATHMNGMTIHAWAGIGIKDHLTRGQLVAMRTKKYLSKNLEEAQVLILDEVSMLHRKQLELVDEVLQFFKDNSEPFGGIQVVFCGDFFQLPPIGQAGERSSDKFAFMSPSWVQADLKICYLTEQFRQADNSLNRILNQIRKGQIPEGSIRALKEAKENQLDLEVEPTKLYTHNLDVDQINRQQLSEIEGKTKRFKATLKGNEKLGESLSHSVLAPSELELKIGAKVMFVKNNPEKGYINGSLGEVIGFTDKGFPSVKTNQGKILTAEPELWSIIDDSGKTLASLNQIPLRLAWAITVHKSQGMTLEAAEIDLSKTFEAGQGYVALSRLKSLENLKLLGFNEQALTLDSLAQKADQRFMQLSQSAEKEHSLKDLKQEAIDFIKNCGGISNAAEIKKREAKLKEKKSLAKGPQKVKVNTYDLSLNYFKQNTPIKEIAEARGMTTGTISSHLLKLKKDHPDVNFSYYKPKSSVLKKVETAYKKQKNQEQVSLKKIHEDCQGQVSYDNIKLALAFLI